MNIEGEGEKKDVFRLEEDSEADRPPVSHPVENQRVPPPANPPAPTTSAYSRPASKGKTLPTGDLPEPLLSEGRRKRLSVYVPAMAMLYLFIGWFFAGIGLGWFFLAGLGVGVFAAWHQRGENLLGTVAAISGLIACMLAVSRPLLFAIISTGIIGFIAGMDDRLRNG